MRGQPLRRDGSQRQSLREAARIELGMRLFWTAAIQSLHHDFEDCTA